MFELLKVEARPPYLCIVPAHCVARRFRVKFESEYRHDRACFIGCRQDRPRSAARDASCLSGAADWPPLGAPRLAQAPQCLGGSESVAAVDPGARQLFKGGWRSIRGRDRLESWFFALRLSRGGLLGATAVIPPSALRAAGPCRDGAETRRPTEHRAQDHAGSPALRPHFASGIEAGAGRRVLFVYVTTRHGGASHRHSLPTECLGGFRSVDLSTRSVPARIPLIRHEREDGCFASADSYPGKQGLG